ncbi:oligosaccharide flippase family protein [Jannaschia sp. LMIT008]|uniref:oligosaccharide flippase family protein n=1 Tax=Jannaschia maritima TaxID=3032585 RepID=UPI00281182C4|nr:oligosaccharide flippase family protein [Jannaschia sp. LMIT008]
MGRSVRALAQTAIWHQGVLAINVAGLMVTARLLPAEAFGLYAIAFTVFQFAAVLVQFGQDAHLIRGRAVTLAPDALATALGVSVATALVAVAILLGTAATFTSLDLLSDLTPLLAIVAGTVAVLPPILILEASLRRDLQTALIVRIDLACAAIQVAGAIALAVWGAGAAALIGGLFASTVARLLLLLVGHPDRPALRPRLTEWRAAFRFGGTYTATGLLPRASVMLRTMLLASVAGPAALGLLNRAQTLSRLADTAMVDGIKPMVLPVMAAALREGGTGARVYLTKVDHLVAVMWPAAIVIAILAEPLVEVLLGTGWTDTVPLVRILALAILAYPFTRMSTKFFAAIGEEGVMLRIQIVQQVIGFALVAGAAFHSIEAVCVALVAAAWIKAFRIARAVRSLTPYDPGAMRRIQARAAALAAAAALGPAVLTAGGVAGPVATLALGGAAAAAGWSVCAMLTRHPLLVQARRLLGV